MPPREFLELLWEGKPQDLYILVWTLPNKNSWWYRDVGEAARYVEKAKGLRDVYTGVGLSPRDWGFHRRCPAYEIKGLCGLWADIDLRGDVHPDTRLPDRPECVFEVLSGVGIPSPTVTVHTGNGLHLWWLFDRLWLFDDPKQPSRVSLGWNTAIREAFEKRGWIFDRLSDLARVLRVPGTFNHKQPHSPKPVDVVQMSGRRFAVSELESVALGVQPDSDPETVVWEGAPSVRVPTQEELAEWLKDPSFRCVWERTKVLRDSSQSGYDMAIASWGVRRGLTADRIAGLIVANRAVWGEQQKSHASYYSRTIGKAMSWVNKETGRFPSSIL